MFRSRSAQNGSKKVVARAEDLDTAQRVMTATFAKILATL
jgi:hypothetical protein